MPFTAVDPTYIDDVAADAYGQLVDTGHAFIDYTPGDGTLYRTVIVLGPRDNEMIVAVHNLGASVALPREQLDRGYVASKLYAPLPTPYNWELRTGVLTGLLNAVVARLAA